MGQDNHVTELRPTVASTAGYILEACMFTYCLNINLGRLNSKKNFHKDYVVKCNPERVKRVKKRKKKCIAKEVTFTPRSKDRKWRWSPVPLAPVAKIPGLKVSGNHVIPKLETCWTEAKLSGQL